MTHIDTLQTQGQPHDPQDAKKNRPGLGQWAGLGQGPRTEARLPVSCFAVPGDPKLGGALRDF